jgi:hypothetical protein
MISRKRGNGVLRRGIWIDSLGVLSRCNLAYINFSIFCGDNGRALGYDNQHAHHHRHFMGETKSFEFVSFEDVEALFELEWMQFLAKR